MRERHVDFRTDEVVATLAGRKTQFRRVVTVPWHRRTRALPYDPYWIDSDGELKFMDGYGDYHPMSDSVSPYGETGDRLWVRELFSVVPAMGSSFGEAMMGRNVSVLYADGCRRDARRGGSVTCNGIHVDLATGVDPSRYGQWRSPVVMPRWASRLLLEITDVRVQRLQDISEDDAIAEGIEELGP